MSQHKAGKDQGKFSGGRFVLSAAVLSLLLLVYFSAPVAFANEDAGSSAYGAGDAVNETTTAADSVLATSAVNTGETADETVSSEPQAASAQYVSADYDLSLICGVGQWGVYWDSREDYDAGLLSIDYRLENHGTGTAYNVCIVDATANQGVTVDTILPLSLGDIVGGGWKYFTLKWLVPQGVGSFRTDVQACVDCEEEDEGAGDDEPGDDDSGDDDSDSDSDDEEDDDSGNNNGNGNQNNGNNGNNGNNNGNQGNNPQIDNPAATEDDSPKDEGGSNSEVPVAGDTPVDEGAGDIAADGGSSGQSATSLYRDALPNTGLTVQLVKVLFGIMLGCFGLAGLMVTLRLAGARRQ